MSGWTLFLIALPVAILLWAVLTLSVGSAMGLPMPWEKDRW